jgi:hypothetical protein
VSGAFFTTTFSYHYYFSIWDLVHTIPAEFENGTKFLRLGIAFTRCRYEKMWNRNVNRKSLKTERNSTVRVPCERLTVRISLRLQNEINKTAKVVVGYFILSILTDLCSILSKRNVIWRYRANSWNRDDFLPAEFHAGIVWTGSETRKYFQICPTKLYGYTRSDRDRGGHPPPHAHAHAHAGSFVPVLQKCPELAGVFYNMIFWKFLILLRFF